MSPLQANPRIQQALRDLRAGRPVLVYDADGREEETDVFFAAEHATPEAIRTLRREAGGLVFLAVHPAVGKTLGLPFLHDLFREAGDRHPVLKEVIPNDIRYDTRSSFSLTINHRETFTGITDKDRALTVSEFANLAEITEGEETAEAMRLFGEHFRAPGHVHLCVGAEGLFANRRGHTEIAVALAELAGVVPVLVGAEMLADDGGRLSKEAASAWAGERGAVHLTGAEIEAAWANLEAPKPNVVA